MMKFVILALSFVLFAGSSASASEKLPTDLILLRQIKVTPPATDVPPEIAAFSGKWEGFVFTGVRRILIVESLTPSGQASVVSSLANEKNPEKVGARRYKGRVQDGTLRFETPNKYEFVFTFVSDELHGRAFKEGMESAWDNTVMVRYEPAFPSPTSRGIYADEESERECKKYIPSQSFEVDYYDSAPGRSPYTSLLVYEFPLGSVQFLKGSCVARSILRYTSGTRGQLPPSVAEIEVDSGGNVHFQSGGVVKVSASGEKIYRYQFIDSKKERTTYKEPGGYTTSHKATWRSQ